MSDAVNECSKELNEKGVQIPPEQLCFDFSHFSQSSCKIAAFFFFLQSTNMSGSTSENVILHSYKHHTSCHLYVSIY